MDVDKERQKLYAAIEDGTTTPDEGEAEAKRLGLAPLCNDPDPSAFNPFCDDWWTLEMALAWIAERTSEAVVQRWEFYFRRCYVWRRGSVGHTLEPRHVPLFVMMTRSLPYREAWGELRARLKDGDVASRGVSAAARAQVAIDPSHWDFLGPVHPTISTTQFESHEPALVYRNVIVRQRDVTRNWPRKLTDYELTTQPTEDKGGVYTLWAATCLFALNDPDGRPQAEAFEDALSRLQDLMYDKKLIATGKNRKGLREAIPNVVWEGAKWGVPHTVEDVHNIGFFEAKGSKYYPGPNGGTLTLYDEEVRDKKPDWNSIELDAADVRTILNPFPERSQPDIEGAPPPPAADERRASPAEVRRWWLDVCLPKTTGQIAKKDIYELARGDKLNTTRSQLEEIVKSHWPEDWLKKSGPKGPRTRK